MKRLLNLRLSLLSGTLFLAAAIVPDCTRLQLGPRLQRPGLPGLLRPDRRNARQPGEPELRATDVRRCQHQYLHGLSAVRGSTYDDDIYAKADGTHQTPIPMTFNDEVKRYINMYAVQKRGLTERVMGLANLYFPLYEQILDQQGLPLEFKYLSIVERAQPDGGFAGRRDGPGSSCCRPVACTVSRSTPHRRTPRSGEVDLCRLSVFPDMYAIYNDWLLVIAAYNCGAGNVNRAITARVASIRSGDRSYLPRETRGYISPSSPSPDELHRRTQPHRGSSGGQFSSTSTRCWSMKVALRDISDAIDIRTTSSRTSTRCTNAVSSRCRGRTAAASSGEQGEHLPGSLDRIYKPQETPVASALFASNRSVRRRRTDYVR